MEWFIADVTAIGSLDRAECAVSAGHIGWTCFWPIWETFVVAEPLCDVGTSS